jgi:hypothetical protein
MKNPVFGVKTLFFVGWPPLKIPPFDREFNSASIPTTFRIIPSLEANISRIYSNPLPTFLTLYFIPFLVVCLHFKTFSYCSVVTYNEKCNVNTDPCTFFFFILRIETHCLYLLRLNQQWSLCFFCFQIKFCEKNKMSSFQKIWGSSG